MTSSQRRPYQGSIPGSCWGSLPVGSTSFITRLAPLATVRQCHWSPSIGWHFTNQLIIRPRRSRSAAAYSRQTFPRTICRSVGPYVRRSVCPVHCEKNGWSDPDFVWHHRSDGSRNETGSAVWWSAHGKGYFWGQIWGAPLQPMGTLRRMCATVPRRGPLPKLLWTNLSKWCVVIAASCAIDQFVGNASHQVMSK